jgi:hypothetical protein
MNYEVPVLHSVKDFYQAPVLVDLEQFTAEAGSCGGTCITGGGSDGDTVDLPV